MKAINVYSYNTVVVLLSDEIGEVFNLIPIPAVLVVSALKLAVTTFHFCNYLFWYSQPQSNYLCFLDYELKGHVTKIVNTLYEIEVNKLCHWNICISIWKLDSQCEFALRCMELKSDAPRQPRGVGWGERWEGGSGGRGYIYAYGWFVLTYGRNQHNIVK